MRIIYETPNKTYRIVEHPDYSYLLEDLKGDGYCPKTNPTLDPDVLKAEEKDFEELVHREGVYGYVLERWNPEAGHGYETIDSCWGFVGQYSETDETFNHYIVNELKEQI